MRCGLLQSMIQWCGVCQSVMHLCHAKTAERIDVLFGVERLSEPKAHCIRWGPDHTPVTGGGFNVGFMATCY